MITTKTEQILKEAESVLVKLQRTFWDETLSDQTLFSDAFVDDDEHDHLTHTFRELNELLIDFTKIKKDIRFLQELLFEDCDQILDIILLRLNAAEDDKNYMLCAMKYNYSLNKPLEYLSCLCHFQVNIKEVDLRSFEWQKINHTEFIDVQSKGEIIDRCMRSYDNESE